MTEQLASTTPGSTELSNGPEINRISPPKIGSEFLVITKDESGTRVESGWRFDGNHAENEDTVLVGPDGSYKLVKPEALSGEVQGSLKARKDEQDWGPKPGIETEPVTPQVVDDLGEEAVENAGVQEPKMGRFGMGVSPVEKFRGDPRRVPGHPSNPASVVDFGRSPDNSPEK